MLNFNKKDVMMMRYSIVKKQDKNTHEVAETIKRALTAIIVDFHREISNQETTEDRRKTAESSLEMWKRLKARVDTQFAEQDK